MAKFEVYSAEFVTVGGNITPSDLRCKKGFVHCVSPIARRITEVEGPRIGVKRSLQSIDKDNNYLLMQFALARIEKLNRGLCICQILCDWHALPETRALIKQMSKEADIQFNKKNVKHRCSGGSIIMEFKVQQRNLRNYVDEENSQKWLNILKDVVSSFSFPRKNTKMSGSDYAALLENYHAMNCEVHRDWTKAALDDFVHEFPPRATLEALIIGAFRSGAPKQVNHS